MGLKSFITDPATSLSAQVNNDEGREDSGLVVATRDLKQRINRIEFFFNPTYGVDMNVTPTAGGVDIDIHDGLDSVLWTATGVVGPARWTFNSVAQSHGGAQSIDATLTLHLDEAQFDAGGDQDLTGYSSVAGWIYITGWGLVGVKEVELYGWDTGGATMVGNLVNLSDYVDTTIFNTWHKFVIPLAHLSLVGQTIDAIRVRTLSTGGGAAPNYYLDDLKVEEEGAPLEYTIEPPHDTWLWMDQITITMVDALDTALADASMHNLSYNKFLGLTELAVGLLFQRYHEEQVTLTVNFHNLLDVLQLPNTNILNIGCDGTNTWMTLNQIFASPILLKAGDGD